MSRLTLLSLSFLFSAAYVAAGEPSEQQHSAMGYIPSNVLTSFALALILLVACVHSWLLKKWGGKFMLVLIIGELGFALGFIVRYMLHSHPANLNIFIAEDLLILLSPSAFLAVNYMMLTRLAYHLESSDLLIVPPRRLALIFISSDVATFLIMAAGSSLATSRVVSTGQLGTHIALAGLILQLVSYAFFTLVFLGLLHRIWTQRYQTWTRDYREPWMHDWRALAFALFISCIGILVRSIFRVAEMSEGFQGHLATTESLFYGLDTLPLFIAISVYVPFWPGKYIATEKAPPSMQVHHVALGNLSQGSETTLQSLEDGKFRVQ